MVCLASSSSGSTMRLLLLCCLGLLLLLLPGCSSSSEAVQAITTRRTPFTAFALKAPALPDATTVFPQHTRNTAISEVEAKPDLEATKFSAQNAFFFAILSGIAYKPMNEVMGLVKGNSTHDGMGFDRFHWFSAGEAGAKSMFDAIQDTQAFVAANDDMIAVVFRGTQGGPDWVANINVFMKDLSESWGFSSGAAHEGFYEGVETVWNSNGGMRQTIKDLCNEEGKDRKLYITGHSLGGALATIAGARLAFEEGMDITAMYTVGSPMVLNAHLAKNFDKAMNSGTPMKDKYFRCRNNNDVVSRVPPTFVHVGTEIYLDRSGAISTTSVLDRLFGRMISLARGELMPDGIYDHQCSEYARIFKQVIINARVPLGDKAVTAVREVLDALVLKVAPEQVVESSENLTRMKNIRSEVEEKKKIVAAEIADVEATAKKSVELETAVKE